MQIPSFRCEIETKNPDGLTAQVDLTELPFSSDIPVAEIRAEAIRLNDLCLSRSVVMKDGSEVRLEPLPLNKEQKERLGRFLLDISKSLNLPTGVHLSSIDLNYLIAELSNEETRMVEMTDEIGKLRQEIDQWTQKPMAWSLYDPHARGKTNADAPILLEKDLLGDSRPVNKLSCLNEKQFCEHSCIAKEHLKKCSGYQTRVRVASRLIEEMQEEMARLIAEKQELYRKGRQTETMLHSYEEIQQLLQVQNRLEHLDRFSIYYALSCEEIRENFSFENAHNQLQASVHTLRKILESERSRSSPSLFESPEKFLKSKVKNIFDPLSEKEEEYALDVALMQVHHRSQYVLHSAHLGAEMKKDSLEFMIVRLVRELEISDENPAVIEKWVSHPYWKELPPAALQVLHKIELGSLYFFDAEQSMDQS